MPALKDPKYKETGLQKFDKKELDMSKLNLAAIQSYIQRINKDKPVLVKLQKDIEPFLFGHD